ncbi:TonB-dependent receptor [uncultured Algoriphagus sp.]|uniref:TonB-dependent receptor n=1 Tax=uncultured Algoriphagus sp. TaxID=417365 RepID=UPI002585F1B6|nr:TonB-dependent receptor [uncultured Algoriphagus sp.]
MLRTILAILVMGLSTLSFAQNTFKAQILDQESNEPLPGATLYFPQLELGESADQEGVVSIANIPNGTHNLQIQFLGYETQRLKITFPLESSETMIFKLEHEHEELEVLLVQSNRSSRVIEDVPTRVEIIAGEELAEKGNMKPGDIRMLLNESTGIQTQQTSATSYNSSIRIQGLDGKYTQLLRDGLPLYSGFASGLSLMQIAPLDLAQVEVIKGSSSTLYGGGAIAGLVNLITKRPEEEPELSFLINGTSALGLDASAFYSAKGEKVGTTVFASYNKGTAYDPADIGLTAIPEFDRFTLNPKLFVDFSERSNLIAGVNFIQEERLGGNMDFIEGRPVNDPYFEANNTDRISTELTFQTKWADQNSLTFKNSLNFFNREIEIPDYLFEGRQISSFSELNWSSTGSKSSWITGLNLWTDQFDQRAGDLSNPLDYSLTTVGAFVQNIWNASPEWTLETGFRLDHLNTEGFFPLPKVSAMFKPNAAMTMRIGGGLGYKSPTVFTEETERIQFQNVVPIDFGALSSERSAGANLDINYRLALGEELSLVANTLLFFTQIQNPLILEQRVNRFEFVQPDGKFETRGIEVNLKWNYRDFKLFTGYTFADVIQELNGEINPYPLVARHRLNNVLMYEKHENFWIGLEAYYFSPQVLNDGQEGQSYWIMGLMTEKVLGEHFSVFLNFENFLDTRQTRFDTIYTGDLSNPEFRDIYAPVDGFVINGGVKLKF